MFNYSISFWIGILITVLATSTFLVSNHIQLFLSLEIFWLVFFFFTSLLACLVNSPFFSVCSIIGLLLATVELICVILLTVFFKKK